MPANPRTTVALAGGGTGGHVFPLAAAANWLSKLPNPPAFLWFGEHGSLEQRVALDIGARFCAVPAGKIRRYFSFRTLATPFLVLAGFFRAFAELRRSRPRFLFSKGGYVSVPVALAARIAGVPVVLHESDAVPGWANRLVGRFARRVLLNFPEAAPFFDASKALCAGPLLSPELFAGAAAPRAQKTRPVLLVLCGSQGSSRIFEALLARPDLLAPFESHVILGTANAEKYGPRFRALPGVTAYDFVSPREIGRLARRADCAVSRSSSAIFELDAFGVRMALVPLAESANGHQLANARAFEKKGHPVVLETELASGLERALLSFADFRKPDGPVPDMPDGALRELATFL